MKDARKVDEQVEKKDYAEPRLEKVQKLQDVTEGVPVVVTGAAVP
ncbi:MAG: hypothetical protein ABFE01_08565 [Phycisphaerales bacterium]